LGKGIDRGNQCGMPRLVAQQLTMVIWLIGLSGAGKTTLGREVLKQWKLTEPNVVLLDGDEVRAVFAHDRGDDAYSVAGRRSSAERMVALCELLDKQGINVICCILSIFPDLQAQNRGQFSRYFEVFLDAPLPVLQARDTKGLYAGARAGRTAHVVGVTIPFQRPTNPDLVIDTSGDNPDIRALAADVLEHAGLA
jgi:adenylylsulfate kinase-like enzyme